MKNLGIKIELQIYDLKPYFVKTYDQAKALQQEASNKDKLIYKNKGRFELGNKL